MKLDLMKASRKLSELDLKVSVDNLTMDILWFRVMPMEKGAVINRHTHSTFEFHFITFGSFEISLDSDNFKTHAGEFYLTAPGVYHVQKALGAGKNVEYCINCDLSLIDDRPSEAREILKVLKEAPCRQFKDTNGIIKFFERALEEAYYQNMGFYSNIKSLASMIVYTAARTMGQNSPVRYDVPLKSRKDNYRLLQVQSFIEDNIANPVTTRDIARYMYLSDKQVCRIVEKLTGMSTKDFIMQIKLQKAKQLLKETNLSIKQVSDSLGFSSEYYFNQFFKREEGYPPGQFRNNIINV